jgi:hypothetical protein
MKRPHAYVAKKRVADYFRANFHLTMSEHYSTPALDDVLAEIGIERVMFSVDYRRCGLVRRCAAERRQPPQDRAHECAQAVQVAGRMSRALNARTLIPSRHRHGA